MKIVKVVLYVTLQSTTDSLSTVVTSGSYKPNVGCTWKIVSLLIHVHYTITDISVSYILI